MRSKLTHFFIFSHIFFFRLSLIHTQNLVPNGSFEEYNDSCTNQVDPGLFENVRNWLPKRYLQGYLNASYSFSTPDYYSYCIPYFYHYPPIVSPLGFQYPYEDESFSGLIYHKDPVSHDQEAIRIELKQSLEQGKCYHAEMFVNYANNAIYVCDKLGMNFTTDSFSMRYDGSIPMPIPQIYTNDVITDTLNWVKIEGNFIANGGERWLTIGWFFDSSEVNYFVNPDTNSTTIITSAYYLIDAVQVYPCTDDEEAIQLPNFISPNGDGKNDFYVIDSLPPQSRVSFFNRWGNEVYSSNDYQNDWNGTHNGAPLSTGTYFVVVQMPHGTKKSTFIELMY